MKGKLSQESVIYPAQYCRKSIANINDARSEVAALNQQKTTLALLALLRANPNSKPTLNAAFERLHPTAKPVRENSVGFVLCLLRKPVGN